MILTIIIFVVILGILVFVHELGHFSMAKFFKVGVEEFGFGFPPKIFGWKKGETIYSLNWIPIGGFVKIKGIVGGDQENTADTLANDSYIKKPIWQRFLILFAGVFMNFMLCGILFGIGYIIGLPSVIDNLPASARIDNKNIAIVEVFPNSSASLAQIEAGDIIKSANGVEVDNIVSFKNILTSKQENEEITLKLERNGQNIEKKLKLIKVNETNEVGIGVYLTETGLVSYPWYQAIYMGFKQTVAMVGMIFLALWNLIVNLVSTGKTSADVTGPIGIAVLTNQMSKLGFIYVLQFTALLSINLAIFNFLPLPALDGGRLLFLLIEKLRGKPTNQKIEAIVHNLGFAFLLLLVLLVTIQDLSRYQVFNYIKNIFI